MDGAAPNSKRATNFQHNKTASKHPSIATRKVIELFKIQQTELLKNGEKRN
jgi:hypothetical protein